MSTTTTASTSPLKDTTKLILTTAQSHALLDILTHAELHSEILDFRHPGTLATYGAPFPQKSANEPSTSPSLQTLVSKFVLPLPGLRDAPASFWSHDVHALIEALAKANLSESYDKGSVGIRKTLATAVSALAEYPVRGVFAGFRGLDEGEEEKDDQGDAVIEAESHDAKALSIAFKNFMRRIVYGDVLERLFKRAAESDRLEDHEAVVRLAHEYILVNLASFMHYTLVISAKGQSLLLLIDSANKLVPYMVIKQTLRIGNVATMINGMVRVVLAKVSLTSVTNWIGLTNNADDGMNLLEQIIYQVLNYEVRDFKSKASKVEKDCGGLKKDHLKALRAYVEKPREEQEGMRQKSQWQSKSIIWVIFNDASVSTNITDHQNAKAQEYLAHHLSIRDREKIIKVLCHDRPDHLTHAIKDVVAAYEPVIRAVHQAVDLSATLGDLEQFIKDTIKLAKIPSKHTSHMPGLHHDKSSADTPPAPTVGDFVQLLKKHQHALHRFLHQCAKNGSADLVPWSFDYAKNAASQFQRSLPNSNSSTEQAGLPTAIDTFADGGAGSLTEPLHNLVNLSIPASEHTSLVQTLDAHAAYLAELHTSSERRLSNVLGSQPSDHITKISHAATFPILSSPITSSSHTKPPSRPATPETQKTRSSIATSAPILSTSKEDSILTPSTSAPDLPAILPSSSPALKPGPGAFLARWQSLLDVTPITPATASGPVRNGSGADLEKQCIGGVNGSGMPDVSAVLRSLLVGFRELLGNKVG